jgi:hypothetical protein
MKELQICMCLFKDDQEHFPCACRVPVSITCRPDVHRQSVP